MMNDYDPLLFKFYILIILLLIMILIAILDSEFSILLIYQFMNLAYILSILS